MQEAHKRDCIYTVSPSPFHNHPLHPILSLASTLSQNHKWSTMCCSGHCLQPLDLVSHLIYPIYFAQQHNALILMPDSSAVSAPGFTSLAP